MSRPRSQSPHYRKLPWKEPNFIPFRAPTGRDEFPMDRGHSFRRGPEEFRENFREAPYPEGGRRSPSFQDDNLFEHQRHLDQEEFHRRRHSPHLDEMHHEDWKFAPPQDGGFNVDGRRGGFREDFQRIKNRGTSPPGLSRERLPSTPGFHPDDQGRESGMGWRRDEQSRGRGRFRNFSSRSDDLRAGGDGERGMRNTHGPDRGRQEESPLHDRGLPFKRPRREMDDNDYLGYRNKKHFEEQGYPEMGSPRDGFEGGPQGNIGGSGPVIFDHDHGIDGPEKPGWKQFHDHRDLNPDFDQRRSSRPRSSSQERFRTSDRRSYDWEDAQQRPFRDNLGDANFRGDRRSPVPQDRPDTMRFGNRGGHSNRRRGGYPFRTKYFQPRGRRPGRGRLPPRSQQSPRGYQDLPPKEEEPGYRPFRGDYDHPIDDEPNWPEEDRLELRNDERPQSLSPPPPVELDPKMPRNRLHGWSSQKSDNVTVVTEETLTIKVDMSRPVNRSSPLCYSSDRQLSLDLVNVGRQRLEFLPMLEHSGTYRETAMHTGTFAQEIITLVHLVKDQYFRGNEVTLNERFSAPQEGSYEEEEEEVELGLTLDERFSSNRGLTSNSALNDDFEALFSRSGPMQRPVRGPGDLRHDLERRRQEKLEEVKVTIAGNVSQRPLGPAGEPEMGYREGFSKWSGQPNRGRRGIMGPRRGYSHRPYQRRNNRFFNRQHNY
ncbi:uncharacterized protein KZ484_017308 [Pholidichthys leucotaenia]